MASVAHRAKVEELYRAKALIECPLRVIAGLLVESALLSPDGLGSGGFHSSAHLKGIGMDLRLRGKRTLVTGSSKGIGEAIARAFASEGAIAIIHGRDREKAERVALDIIAQGGQAHVVVGDLTDDNAVEQLIAESIKMVGAVDILVNNAGGSGSTKG